MIDNPARTNFLDRLLRQAQARFRQLFQAFVACAILVGGAALQEALSPLFLLPGILMVAALVLRAYRDLQRAYATLEAVYRREDSRCRPWG